MSKYIDAEKLIAEIERLVKVNKELKPSRFTEGIAAGYGDVLSVITSLQQEQPEPSNNLIDADAVREDFITEVYRVLDADPTNDRANAIINAFDSLPTVPQEQPEVDLEKELRNYNVPFNDCGWERLTHNTLKEIARHFWNKGYNAGKEGTK